ncbi:MAG: HD domain-containing protein [Oscillospiraceae bacterium]|nr:HD domain-containing protein [Oscillospiraceae bacterium]
MLPSRDEAERILREAEPCNPGPWGNHSRVAARCAEKIAQNCAGMDSDKAYILGLLHDIGRKFGVRHLGHVSNGYQYMMSLGYDEAARICISHSFSTKHLDDYVGNRDTSPEEWNLILSQLEGMEYDDYDRLIQLCDAIAGAEGVLNMEERMNDVRRRYGFYPPEKWESNFRLKRYFESKMGRNLYDVVREASPEKQTSDFHFI